MNVNPIEDLASELAGAAADFGSLLQEKNANIADLKAARQRFHDALLNGTALLAIADRDIASMPQ